MKSTAKSNLTNYHESDTIKLPTSSVRVISNAYYLIQRTASCPKLVASSLSLSLLTADSKM